MKLNDVDLSRFLPHFMSDDANTQAFVYAVQSQINYVSANIELAKIYSRVDKMTDELLDELAWQFSIPEYSTDYDIPTKRNLVKNAMVIHHKRGTVGAVEQTVQNIFGNGTLQEWFDYGGKPYHFKVRTSNPNASDEMIADLERIVRETQNVRSYLEEVIVELMQSMNLYVGARVFIMDDVSLKTVNNYS